MKNMKNFYWIQLWLSHELIQFDDIIIKKKEEKKKQQYCRHFHILSKNQQFLIKQQTPLYIHFVQFSHNFRTFFIKFEDMTQIELEKKNQQKKISQTFIIFNFLNVEDILSSKRDKFAFFLRIFFWQEVSIIPRKQKCSQ